MSMTVSKWWFVVSDAPSRATYIVGEVKTYLANDIAVLDDCDNAGSRKRLNCVLCDLKKRRLDC
jgi:hypothetical protein